jgi:hypothetical protein
VDDVIKRKHGAAVELVEILYTSFTKRKPCHAQIGEITTKVPSGQSAVSVIQPPPELPKPQEEQAVDTPPIIPKRQKFIGVSATQRSGSQSDLTPISFESASVVKSGPGFLQLRNNATQSTIAISDKVLDNAVDRINQANTPENLQAFAKTLENPEYLTLFLTNYPSDLIIEFLRNATPYFSPESSPYIISTIADLFIPIADMETVTVDDLVNFIFTQPSDDPFTHHFLLSKVLEVTDPPAVTAALALFVRQETKFSKPLCQYILGKVRDYADNDTPHALPEVLSKLLEFDRAGVISLIPLFPPSGDQRRDFALVDFYVKAPEESSGHIQSIIESGDRGIAAYLLDRLIADENVPREVIIFLLMGLPDSEDVLGKEFVIPQGIDELTIGPLVGKLNPLETVQLIQARIAKNQPDAIDREILVMNLVMQDLKSDEIGKWNEVFQALHEYIYLAFCDQNVCKQAGEVCLTFFKLLQNDVFGTFSTLFKALNYVFPGACPAFCKSNAVEFLTTASELGPSFAQTVLKLLMNFPPKTNADVDKLIVHLKKVRK